MEKIISISTAAKMLGVTITTLRRWDKAGKLKSIRAGGTGHRLYRKKDISLFTHDLPSMARDWASDDRGEEPNSEYYCPNSSIFQARLTKMGKVLSDEESEADIKAIHSLLGAVAGEIGNNSFDHNLGNWPDIPGIFFGYDASKRVVVLADRGNGILSTLRRVRPELPTHEEALKVAFTERITGRAPESRGNGLKFVRKVVSEYPLSLEFQTGDAKIEMKTLDTELNFVEPDETLRGCAAIIRF